MKRMLTEFNRLDCHFRRLARACCPPFDPVERPTLPLLVQQAQGCVVLALSTSSLCILAREQPTIRKYR